MFSFIRGLLFVGILVLILPFGLSTDIKELSTGILFPTTYKGKKTLELAGTGVRVKQLGPIKAKVYAVGLYVDKLLVARKIKSLKLKSEEQLRNLLTFENEVTGGESSEKTFELRMARNVGATTMVSALCDSVGPRLGDANKVILKQFEKLVVDGLKGGDVVKDMVLSFEASPSGLLLKINGVKKGSISSSELSKAFTKVYLDKNCVSPALKSSVSKTVFEWSK